MRYDKKDAEAICKKIDVAPCADSVYNIVGKMSLIIEFIRKMIFQIIFVVKTLLIIK